MTVSEKIVADFVANDVEFITTVPCKQLAGVIDAVEANSDIYHIPSNKEDEGWDYVLELTWVVNALRL
jgi:sulfopyruvate decarboxylase subunit alpha